MRHLILSGVLLALVPFLLSEAAAQPPAGQKRTDTQSELSGAEKKVLAEIVKRGGQARLQGVNFWDMTLMMMR